MVSVIHPSSTQHFGPYNPYTPSSDVMNYTPVQAYTGQHLTWPSSSLFRTFYRPQNPFNLQNRPRYDVKDYSKPLFVDCSIEYELPNAPKVPKNSEPILMIHPSYMKPPRIYLKAKSTNRSNQIKNSLPKVSATKKSVKRSYKQGPSGEISASSQVLPPQSQVVFTGCYCCQCHHPVATASKRSRQMYYEPLKQQQHPLFQYPQGLNFRYGLNWT